MDGFCTAAMSHGINACEAHCEAREKGIGRAILQAVAESCAGHGISYIEVQTDDEAADFYAACGFEAAPEVRVMSVSNVLGDL